MNRPPIRTTSAVASVIVSSLLLSACTPHVDGKAAVTVDSDGNVVGIFDMCGDKTADIFYLGNLDREDPAAIRTWRSALPLGPNVRITLFEPADAGRWIDGPGGSISTDAQDRYQIWAQMEGSEGSATGRFTFTQADLVDLAPGDVLAMKTFETTNPDGDRRLEGRVAQIPEAEFRQMREDSCE